MGRINAPNVSVGIGAAAVVAAGLLASTLPTTDPSWRFGIVLAAVAIFAAFAGDGPAVAWAAGLGWLVTNGFLVDRFGELSWHGRSDLYRAVMLMVAGGLGLLIGRVRQERRRRHHA